LLDILQELHASRLQCDWLFFNQLDERRVMSLSKRVKGTEDKCLAAYKCAAHENSEFSARAFRYAKSRNGEEGDGGRRLRPAV